MKRPSDLEQTQRNRLSSGFKRVLVSVGSPTGVERSGLGFVRHMCQAERPLIHPDERIVFTCATPRVLPIYSPELWGRKASGSIARLGICAQAIGVAVILRWSGIHHGSSDRGLALAQSDLCIAKVCHDG
jgi:hypothetical protein